MRFGTTSIRLLQPCLRALLSALSVCMWAGWVLAQDPPYKAFTTDDGLPSNTVYDALQDRDGYMWFATDAGVCRFDGSRCERFTTKEGLTDNEVFGLFEDSQGRIWFLTMNGRPCYFQGGRCHNASDHPEFNERHLTSGGHSMAEDSSGAIWMSSIGSDLFCWRPGRMTNWTDTIAAAQDGKKRLVEVASTCNKSAYAISGNAFFQLQDGHAKLIRTWNGDPGGFARVCADGDRIIARGAYGFVAMEHDHDDPVFPLSRIPYQLDAAASVMANDGEVWITLKEGGVLRIRPNAPGASSPEQLFHNAIVLDAYKDNDGGLWIMTDGIGVLMVTPDQIHMRQVVLGEQYRTRAVSALCTMPEGGVAFGTMNGSLYRYEVGDQAQLLVPSRSMAVRDRVRDIQLDVAGRLWFATDSWIGHLSGAGHRVITGPFSSMDDLYPDMHAGRIATAKSIATGPHGEVVASMFSLARLLDTLGKEQFLYEKQYRTDRERIYAPFVDRHGQLWYETSAQLHRWARGAPSDLSSLDGAFRARITDVDELPDGTMVVATDGNGLVLLRNDAVVGRIGHRDGMPSDRVNTAVVRGDRILVATDAGGCIVDHAHGDKVLRSWDVHAGLPSAEVFDIDGDDRYVYFATPAGLCVAPLNSPMYARRPPRLSLQMFISGDSVMSDYVPPTIPLGADALIRLRAPEFASPGRMEYFMRQDGDTLWSQAKQELSLAGLEAGTHRFEFKARILGSPWSEVVGLMVVIEPPWYATTWFRSLGFLLFIGLGGLIAWLISRRRFQRREAGLHLLMAKQEERQRIAAGVHDDLGADISHLLMLTRESAGSTSLTQADRDNLRNIELNANGIMQKVDEIIWSLDPRDDEGSNALGFIQGYAEAFADAHNMVFRTQALPDLSETRITPTDRREVYLIVKELLNNIAKHTQATELRIVFSVNNGMARIVIDDNGEPIGAARLSANTLRRGHGLANMQERIARLSGTLRSGALQPIGTRVSITFPIGYSTHEAKGQLSSLPPDPAP